MGFNFIGMPLTLLFLASIAGVIYGLLKKDKKVLNASLIVLAVVVVIYIIFALIA